MDKAKQAAMYAVGAVVIIVWVLWGLSSCIVVNPCPAIADRGEAAYERGDTVAFNDAVDDYIENDCQEGK